MKIRGRVEGGRTIERPMEKVWFVDKMEVCKTCKLRVDTQDMGLECDVCKVWAHTKCEKKSPKTNTKSLRKNTPRLAGSAKNAKR